MANLENVSPFLRGKLTRNAKGDVEAPDNIILSLSGGYTQYSILRQDHIARVDLFAALEGAAAGNPPFDQDELEANGLGHKTNFNDFKFRSYIERGSQAYWNLINGTDVFIKLWLKGNAPELYRYGRAMARNLSDVIKEWDDFHTNMNIVGTQLTKFGLSPIFWPHEKSFMWEAVDVSKFLIPTQTQTLKSKFTNCAIESNYTIQELYQIYKKIGNEKTSDWNRDALGSFLIWKANTLLKLNDTTQFTDMLQIQRLIDNNDVVSTQYFNDSVRLVNLYQQEYDGKISHYIFDRDRLATAKFDATVAMTLGFNDFLFFADRQYNHFREAIQVFTASPGEWTIHGSIGIGQKTFAGTQAINLLSCSLIDMGLMSSTPLVRTLATGGRDTNPIKFIPGVATDIGAAEFVQNQLGTNINQLVLASQYTTAILDTNAVNMGDDPSLPDKAQGSISPSEARSRDFKEFGVLKTAAAHFYKQFDGVIQNMLVRLMKAKDGDPGYEYLQEWKERCEMDGVPPELFDNVQLGFKGLPKQFRAVRAARVAGDGSNLARIMGLESLDKITGTFDTQEMRTYKREWVEATNGPDAVEAFAGGDQADDADGNGVSVAAAENFMMQQGAAPTFSIDNEQDAHAATHMALNLHTIQLLDQQQMSPVDADKIFTNSIPHTSQHIQAMQKAPLLYRETLQKIIPPFNEVLKRAELNRKNAEAMVQAAQRKQQEDAAKTQEVLSDTQRKDYVAQDDQRLKQEKQTAQIDRNRDTVRQRGDIMREDVQKKAENQQLKIQLDHAVKVSTAKGASQDALENSSPEDLAAQSKHIIGGTPSSVDFERAPSGPLINGKVPL